MLRAIAGLDNNERDANLMMCKERIMQSALLLDFYALPLSACFLSDDR